MVLDANPLCTKQNHRRIVVSKPIGAVPVAVLLTTIALTYGMLNLYAGFNNLNLIRDFINWKIN